MRKSLLQSELILTKPLFSIFPLILLRFYEKPKMCHAHMGLWVIPKLVLLMQNNKIFTDIDYNVHLDQN